MSGFFDTTGSGTTAEAGVSGTGQSEVSNTRIVDVLQQMVRMQGLLYQLLLNGPSVVTVRPILTAAANDAAAAAAGVPVGALYQNAGAVRQRLV